jgi:hypothetical protein
MNLNFILHLTSALIVGIFGFFVFIKNRKNIYFTTFCTSIFLWLFASSQAYLSKTESQALFWFKVSYIGIIFIPSTFYSFISHFLGDVRRRVIFLNYTISLVFVFLLYFYHNLVIGLYKYPWGYYPKVSPVSHLPFLLFFATLFATTIVAVSLRLWSKSITISTIEKNRLKYIFLGIVFGTLGAIDFLPNYGIGIHSSGFIFMVIFPCILAYAIVRHQLMDIEVIIKKSLVFAGMFVFSFGVFVVVTLLVSRFLGGNSIVSLALSALIIIIGLRPIETWLVNSTDKFLFQKKYEYKQIIRAFIDKVATELNLNEVVSSTLKILDQALHPYALGIFILNKVEDKYQLYDSSGLEDKNITFNSDSRLVAFLKKTHNPAVIKQIDGISGANPEALSDMSQLKAVLVLPLLLRNDLIGFISLGRKKSDEDYTKDDLDVLLDLARTESITVGNAQLLTEAAQAERRAAIGTMSAGINHEIGNPLNIMSTRIQVFKLERQKGYFKDTPKEKALDQAEAALDECLKQSDRISDITKKLSNFAKPSKEFKPQLINILEEIEEKHLF